MDSNIDAERLIKDMESDDEGARKMAVFQLQTVIGDPSFADVFITNGGLPKLRALVLHATGNTLAYSLSSFSNLLGLELGWEWIHGGVIDRLVDLIVGHPLVNILRGAMSILAFIVSHPQPENHNAEVYGFNALRPALEKYPQFMEMLVSRLSSEDHALCLNALQLVNALIRDSMANGEISLWAKFIKKLQDLGVIEAVHSLMQDPSVQDLAPCLLDFQSLTKVLLRKYREIRVSFDKPEHRRAMKAIFQASHLENKDKTDKDSNKTEGEKWQRLGFDSESPEWEFDEVGFLGMMDLSDFARRAEDYFQKLLLEQSSQSIEVRCPIAKASLAVTSILYDHFEVDMADLEDHPQYAALESRSNLDALFKPLLLQWTRLHSSGVRAFIRLWDATRARRDDFAKIEELVRILVEHIVGLAPRTKNVSEIEESLATYELHRLRELQMELLELTHEDAWGHHLRDVKSELRHEALQFVKEQRIRCLLEGSWFPNPSDGFNGNQLAVEGIKPTSWRFVKLSHNRRYLHYDDFDIKTPEDEDPSLEALEYQLDVSIISSVVSHVSPATQTPTQVRSSSISGQSNWAKEGPAEAKTNIIIHGRPPNRQDPPKSPARLHRRTGSSRSNLVNDGSKDAGEETVLLTLEPATTTLASEWLDGLLMLLNQSPITAETNKLVDFIAKYGLRIRLLNVRFEEALNGMGPDTPYGKEVKLPGREGLDEDYYYDIAGGA